jgi:hypothetical protein
VCITNKMTLLFLILCSTCFGRICPSSGATLCLSYLCLTMVSSCLWGFYTSVVTARIGFTRSRMPLSVWWWYYLQCNWCAGVFSFLVSYHNSSRRCISCFPVVCVFRFPFSLCSGVLSVCLSVCG